MEAEILKQQEERVPQAFESFKKADLSFPTNLLKQQTHLTGNTSVGNFSSLHLAQFQGKTVFVKTLETEKGKEHYAYVELAILKNLKLLNHQQAFNGSNGTETSTKNNFHILEFIGAFEKAGKVKLVCEYLERGDLKVALRRDLQYFKKDVNAADLEFVWKQRVRAVTHISTAINRLHELNIVHRDIKCENIFLSGRGKRTVFKLGDFGMARGIHSIDLDEPRTYTICGTDELMAPEMLLALPYDHSVDVYSLGLVIGELMCGRGPSSLSSGSQYLRNGTDFRGEFLQRSGADAFDLDLKDLDRYAVAGCPLELIELAKQCLSYESRYRLSVSELLEAMHELEADLKNRKAERVPSKVPPMRQDKKKTVKNSENESPNINHTATQDSFFPRMVDEKTLRKTMLTVDGKYDIDAINRRPGIMSRGLNKMTKGLRKKKSLGDLSKNKYISKSKVSRQMRGRRPGSKFSSSSMASTTRSVGKRVAALQAHLAEKQRRPSNQEDIDPEADL